MNLYEQCVHVIRMESLGTEVVSSNPFQINCTQESAYNISRFYIRFHHIHITTSYTTGECVKERDDWFIL